MIDLLQSKGAEYAIKVPFYTWIGMKDLIRANRVWDRVENGIDCFEEDVMLKQWKRCLRVVIYRKRVGHESPKNYQLDLFDPSDGQGVLGGGDQQDATGPNLWYYMCGRGCHEKVFGGLKRGYAFDTVPTMKYAATGAWQILSVLASNLMRGLQAALTPAPTRTARARTRLHLRLRDDPHDSLYVAAARRYRCATGGPGGLGRRNERNGQATLRTDRRSARRCCLIYCPIGARTTGRGDGARVPRPTGDARDSGLRM